MPQTFAILAQDSVVAKPDEAIEPIGWRQRVGIKNGLAADFRQACAIRRNDWAAQRHRFQRGQAEAFGERRKCQTQGAVIKSGQFTIGTPPEPNDIFGLGQISGFAEDTGIGGADAG